MGTQVSQNAFSCHDKSADRFRYPDHTGLGPCRRHRRSGAASAASDRPRRRHQLGCWSMGRHGHCAAVPGRPAQSSVPPPSCSAPSLEVVTPRFEPRRALADRPGLVGICRIRGTFGYLRPTRGKSETQRRKMGDRARPVQPHGCKPTRGAPRPIHVSTGHSGGCSVSVAIPGTVATGADIAAQRPDVFFRRGPGFRRRHCCGSGDTEGRG